MSKVLFGSINITSFDKVSLSLPPCSPPSEPLHFSYILFPFDLSPPLSLSLAFHLLVITRLLFAHTLTYMYTRLLISASLHWFLACLSGMSLQVDYSREVSATDYSIPIQTIIRSPPLLPCQFPSLQDLVSPSPPTSIKKKPL